MELTRVKTMSISMSIACWELNSVAERNWQCKMEGSKNVLL